MALKSLVSSLLALALAALLGASCAPVRQHEASQAAPHPHIVTHAELAQRIVWMTGDETEMPARATGLDYEKYLAGKGIAPLGGWRHRDVVTKGDLAVVTVRLLRLQRRVENPADEASYIALLESIELRTITE